LPSGGLGRPRFPQPRAATLTPQEAINQGLAKPSECDIVVVIFWARMGTPLPDDYKKSDGSRYLSGTEWEYEDAESAAKRASKPLVVIYRRTEEPSIKLSDPEFEQKRQQWQRVQDFFKRFTAPTGEILGGYTPYETPEEFRKALENDLKILIQRILDQPDKTIHTPKKPHLREKLSQVMSPSTGRVPTQIGAQER
jgi:hypothetical protein